jgi:hypothetical protein
MFLAAGCEDVTSSSNPSDSVNLSGSGTLYQLQGIVIDSVTGQPLSGVTVELDSSRSVQTDAVGTFLIKDVIPDNNGTNAYNLSVYKDGYAAIQQAVPVLDVNQFFTDDPFNEIEVQTELLAAFNEWVTKQEIPQDGTSVTNNGWTYSGGGTFNNNGGGSVTYNEAANQFEWNLPLKVDYTYSYGVGISVVQLAPLIGGLTGKINVVFAEKDADTHAAAAPIKDDVEVYVSFAGPPAKTYGPVLTKDGVFSIEGLPATGAASIKTNGFFQSDANGVEQFFDGIGSATFSISSLTTTTVSGAAAGTQTIAAAPEKFIARVNDVYLFKATNIAFVASANVGTGKSGEFLAVTDPITLTFTKDIDAASFSAYLDANNSTTYTASNDYAFDAVWTDTKSVTLTVRVNPTTGVGAGYTYPHLPYGSSYNLLFSGKAADGSKIAKNDLPVYTEPALALIKTEVIASPPARVLAVSTGNAVKFTFSKAIADISSLGFYEYNNTPAATKKLYHKVDGAEVYVYIDGPLATGTDRIGYQNIFAAGDPDDTLANANTGTGSLVSVAASTSVSLRATNLYKPDEERDFADKGTDPSGTEAYFSLGSNITLTLTNPLPAGATAYAYLSQAGTEVPIVINTSATGVITIDPTNNLVANRLYRIEIKILLDGQDIFAPGLIPSRVADVNGSNQIEFTTVLP